MLKKDAIAITHTLSNTSKMPGKSYSISAFSCKTGSKLAEIPGTVCSNCYARKNAYVWKTTQEALAKRESSLEHPQWVEAMVTLIGDEEYFRWHDSGDIQSIHHLHKICLVAAETPSCNHWLPTKEIGMVTDYVKLMNGGIPENLVIRLSAPKIDAKQLKLSKTLAKQENVQSCRTVSKVGTVDGTSTYLCPAPTQGNACKDCRACWTTNIEDVAYLNH